MYIKHVIFQSTRPSRASTFVQSVGVGRARYFNPQGPRGPRPSSRYLASCNIYFNPQGPRGPRRIVSKISIWSCQIFQSTRPSRASTILGHAKSTTTLFQSTRPSRASTLMVTDDVIVPVFQSTRPSRASTRPAVWSTCGWDDFNPQGPRGPRHGMFHLVFLAPFISIHKALAGLDAFKHKLG